MNPGKCLGGRMSVSTQLRMWVWVNMSVSLNEAH